MTDIEQISRLLHDALESGDPAAALLASDRFFDTDDRLPCGIWFLRAQVAERANDYVRALRGYRHVARADDADPQQLYNSGYFLLNTGRPWDALGAFDRLDARLPGNTDVMAGRARALLETGDHANAVILWEAVLAKTGTGEARLQLAMARAVGGDVDGALQDIGRDGAMFPQLIGALHARGCLGASRLIAEKGTRLFADNAEAWNCLGAVSASEDDTEAALRCYQKALALDPDHADALFNLGSIRAESGVTADAVAAFRSILKDRPDDIRTLRYLADSIRFTPEDGELETLERLSRSADLSDYDRASVHYALGKAMDDMGRYQDAIAHYAEGGRSRGRIRGYAVADECALLDRVSQLFANPQHGADDPGVSASDKPVFVVGLPRSGTTLVEQILAGHDDVTGAGELGFLRDAVLRHADGRIGMRTLPAWEFLDGGRPAPEVYGQIADEYLAALERLAPASRRVVDKQPMNDRYLGFAMRAFPSAVVIHCVRDLRDTCLSCFSKNFEAEFAFSDTLEGMADYALAQRRLMAFWEDRFPGRIVDISYEALVANPETEARRLIAAVGLEWSDRCLDLTGSSRRVRTASARQVKHDVYTSAVKRWKRYMPAIEPLVSRLNGAA